MLLQLPHNYLSTQRRPFTDIEIAERLRDISEIGQGWATWQIGQSGRCFAQPLEISRQ